MRGLAIVGLLQWLALASAATVRFFLQRRFDADHSLAGLAALRVKLILLD